MATVTDVLVTQLRIVGVQEVRSGLRDASFAFNQMAEEQTLATAATGAFHTALGALDSPLALVGIAVAAVTAEFTFLADAIKAFSASEDSVARVALQLKDLGGSFPINDLIAFSDRLEHLTGIDGELITSLGGAAAQFGLTRTQIEKLIPTVLDLAVANKKGPLEVLNAILRTTATGQTRGLAGLHINTGALKGDLKDIDNLVSQISGRFEGVAEGFRHTLPGSIAAFGNAVTNFMEAVGRFLSPAVLLVLNAFTAKLEEWTLVLTKIADALSFVFPTAAKLGEGGKPNPLALKGDPEQTELMRQTANNTAKLEPFIDKVLGGTGEVAGRSFTWRDAKAAFGA